MEHKQERESTIKVKVSDLTQYLICPRLVYFSARGHEQHGIAKGKERSVIESILLKELAFNLHTIRDVKEEEVEGEEMEDDVKRVIEDIVDGVEWIYKEELKGVEKNFLRR